MSKIILNVMNSTHDANLPFEQWLQQELDGNQVQEVAAFLLFPSLKSVTLP
jgi:hypothetical protein